jgi:hypothetical protein
MQCRNCHIEIADKALICYRCGTATTEAKYKPVPIPQRGSRGGLVVSVLVIVLLALGAGYVQETATTEAPRLASWIVVAVAVLVVAIRGLRRRGSRRDS